MSASTTEVQAVGTVFQYGALAAVYNAPTSGWTTLAKVTDIKKTPSVKLEKLDTTELTATTETAVAGRGKPSDFEVEVKYTKATYSTAVGLRGTQMRFRVLGPDGTGIGFEGFIDEVMAGPDGAKLWKGSVKGQASGDTVSVDTNA